MRNSSVPRTSSLTAGNWVREQLERIEPEEEPVKDQFLAATRLAATLKPDAPDPVLDPEEFALFKTVFEKRPRLFYWSDIKEEVRRAHRSLTMIQEILEELPPGFEEAEKRELLSLLSRASTSERDPYNQWQPPALDWFLATLRQYRRIDSPQKRFLDYLAPLQKKKEIRSSDFVLIYNQVKNEAFPFQKTPPIRNGIDFLPLTLTPFHQVAVEGQTIPLRLKVSPFHPSGVVLRPIKMDGLEVEFYRKDSTNGQKILLGTGITDADGIATLHYRVESPDPLNLLYNIKNDPRDFRQSKGHLQILSTKKPVIAVDLDGLRDDHLFWSGVTESLQKLTAAGYQPVAIVHRGA
ncbi:MAG: hypothetical protein HY539_01320, partial [Deltaproteobacteria bacterium]|nr:hypothetical protein [Deltaproteobacteria bacterium]